MEIGQRGQDYLMLRDRTTPVDLWACEGQQTICRSAWVLTSVTHVSGISNGRHRQAESSPQVPLTPPNVGRAFSPCFIGEQIREGRSVPLAAPYRGLRASGRHTHRLLRHTWLRHCAPSRQACRSSSKNGLGLEALCVASPSGQLAEPTWMWESHPKRTRPNPLSAWCVLTPCSRVSAKFVSPPARN
jgi:hypothetical protein